MNRLTAFLAFAALALASTQAFAQASVTEIQTTLLYVDATLGSDTNTGVEGAPLLTVGAAAAKAIANNVSGIATRVMINPGIYRESVTIEPANKQTGATMTFQAATPGTVFLDGSDVLTAWQPVSNTQYVHSWQNTLAACLTPSGWTGIQPIGMRTEMVFVNGLPLTQILDPVDQRPGTFSVDTVNQQINLWPPAGTDMTAALVEVASRRFTLEVHGRSNLVFRGLTFRHAASCIDQSSANVFSSTNILFDRVQANWNNWGGLEVSTSNHTTIKNSIASNNGGVGISSFESLNALFLHNETDYNNWRGAMSALYDFGQGGTKLMRLHNGQIVDQLSYRNQAQGLWFDTDNKNIIITRALLSENAGNNLQIEANEGPFLLQNSRICSSQAAGLELVNTAGLTATGNTFYNNGGTSKWQAQFFLAGNPGGRAIKDWETAQPYLIFSSNTTLFNNIFTDAGVGQYLFSTYTAGNDWTKFQSSLNSTANTWNDSLDPTAFKLPAAKNNTLSGWQNITGQDQSSTSSPSTVAAKGCYVPPPGYPDFYVGADQRTYLMSNGSATINLLAKSFDFAAATLSTSALPVGVTASFSASTVTSGISVLTLTASSNAAPRAVPVTIFATSGNRVHSVTVTVTVSSI